MQHRILIKWLTVFAISVAVASTNSRSPALGADKVKFALPGNSMGYLPLFVAVHRGFFKDEGYDFKMIQGGSGVKTREILASRQGDFAIADILHVLQLNNWPHPIPFQANPPLWGHT